VAHEETAIQWPHGLGVPVVAEMPTPDKTKPAHAETDATSGTLPPRPPAPPTERKL